MANASNDATSRVLIVGCGFPQLGLLRAARALGLYVIGVDGNPQAIGVPVCDAFLEISTHDVERIAAAAREAGAQGITTCGSELALTTTVRVAKALGLPFYADVATVERCQAKDLMREAYQRGGAPIPVFRAVTTRQEFDAFVREQGLPVVVKPSRGWGQRGVSKIEVASEIAAAYEGAQRASSTGVVLAEEFIEGKEFSVNAYTLKGETTVCSVTERVITQYPDPPGITFAEWYPSGLARDAEQQTIDAALAGVRALGIVRGPSYTQLRHGPKGARIVETAHRLGGGLDPDVALLASGISLFRKILGVAMGRTDWEASGREAEVHGGAIGKFLVGRPGKVQRVEGVDAARAMPGVVAAETYVREGATVHPLTDGSRRAGHVLAVGRDRDEAEAHAAAAAALIHIHTQP